MLKISLIAVISLSLVSLCWPDIPAPVEFKSTQMKDIGNFHGDKPANDEAGWYFWGGREPIVTPDWIVFPYTGVYRFQVECKSHQFDPGDTAKGIFAEFDIRAHIFGEKNNLGEIKKLIRNVADTQGDKVWAHGSASADDAVDPWKWVEVTSSDPTTGEPIEIQEGTKAQLEIWFTNDKWQAPKDRNLWVRGFKVLLPEGLKISVSPKGKLTTTWGALKRR